MQETIKNHVVKIQVLTVVAVIGFAISMTTWVVSERNEMNNNIERCTEQAMTNKAHIVVLEASEQEQDIAQARIETQLAQIFTILEEIKLKLK